MKQTLVAAALLLLTTVAIAQQNQSPKPAPTAASVEAGVRKLWQSFKSKDKAALSSLLDDRFRQFEEGLTTFGDKKSEVNAVDEYDLLRYTLSNFTVTPTGPNTALVTYIALYEGKSNGDTAKARSVFGEVWVRSGNDWKDLYMQETYMK